MKYVRRGALWFWRLSLWSAALGLFAVFVYLGIGMAGAVLPNGATGLVVDAALPKDERREVGLISGPIHYDFVLPADRATREAFGFVQQAGLPLEDPQVHHLVVGWGARAFYTATGSYRDLRWRPVWRGATGDQAVMRLGLAGSLEAWPVQWISLTPEQYQTLTAAILNELDSAQPLTEAGGAGALFFPAKGRFDLRRTCNVWIGEMLGAAGLRFGRWTPIPQAVRLSLWWHQGVSPAR